MTVKELIDILQTLPADAIVYASDTVYESDEGRYEVANAQLGYKKGTYPQGLQRDTTAVDLSA